MFVCACVCSCVHVFVHACVCVRAFYSVHVCADAFRVSIALTYCTLHACILLRVHAHVWHTGYCVVHHVGSTVYDLIHCLIITLTIPIEIQHTNSVCVC